MCLAWTNCLVQMIYFYRSRYTKEKKVDGRYCKHALELHIHIDIPPQFVAALIVYAYKYHKNIESLAWGARMFCRGWGVCDGSFLVHLVMNIRHSNGILHEACSASTTDLVILLLFSTLNTSQPIWITCPLCLQCKWHFCTGFAQTEKKRENHGTVSWRSYATLRFKATMFFFLYHIIVLESIVRNVQWQWKKSGPWNQSAIAYVSLQSNSA